jgi:hypothetical protein
MQKFIGTIFGDKRIFMIAAINVILAYIILRTPAAGFAGLILPLGLFSSAVYLAKH